jgi:hypothetical protein
MASGSASTAARAWRYTTSRRRKTSNLPAGRQACREALKWRR